MLNFCLYEFTLRIKPATLSKSLCTSRGTISVGQNVSSVLGDYRTYGLTVVYKEILIY